jgi:hypothetical protein
MYLKVVDYIFISPVKINFRSTDPSRRSTDPSRRSTKMDI